MRDLGLITYNAQAGYDFLVKTVYNQLQGASVILSKLLEGYVMKIEGAKKWNDKCDTTFRELATSSAFLSSKFYDQRTYSKLRKYFRTLHESMKRFNRPATKYGFETLFGSDAVRGATILFKEGANGVNSMWDAMSK